MEAIYIKGNDKLSSWAEVYDFREGIMKFRKAGLEQMMQFGVEEPSQETICPHPPPLQDVSSPCHSLSFPYSEQIRDLWGWTSSIYHLPSQSVLSSRPHFFAWISSRLPWNSTLSIPPQCGSDLELLPSVTSSVAPLVTILLLSFSDISEDRVLCPDCLRCLSPSHLSTHRCPGSRCDEAHELYRDWNFITAWVFTLFCFFLF